MYIEHDWLGTGTRHRGAGTEQNEFEKDWRKKLNKRL